MIRILIFLTLFASSCKPKISTCTIAKVRDGDTYVLMDKTVVRLLECDSPELRQTYGKEAKGFATTYLLNKNVRIERAGYDKYNRVLAKIYLQDGTYFNQLMVRRGQAHVSYKYCRDKKLIEEMETARRNRVGLWAYSNTELPYHFRKKQQK